MFIGIVVDILCVADNRTKFVAVIKEWCELLCEYPRTIRQPQPDDERIKYLIHPMLHILMVHEIISHESHHSSFDQ